MYNSVLPFLIFILFISDLSAQIDTALLSSITYRFAGPYRGGRCTAVAGHHEQPHTFYMGGSGGGVWKTNDAGLVWKNVSDGQIRCGSIGSVTVAPSSRNIVYVGTGSDSPRGNVSMGVGAYKSEDHGKSWTHIGLDQCGQIGDVIVHPGNPDIVYAAALGNIFMPNKDRGVYKSMDGGKTWIQILFLSDTVGAVDLEMHPQNPTIIYAGMWRAERKPWTIIDGGTEGGLYQTKNGGTTWQKIENGLPDGIIGKIGVTISPANPDRIWVIQQAAEEKKGGVYRSDDGGNTFKRINRDHKLRQRGWYYSRIFADPLDENTVYVTNTGFYKSIDGGKNFDHRYPVPHGDNHDVWINPHDPDIMINSNDGGANITLNGGISWSTQTNQPTAEFYRLSVDNQWPYRMYAGQQDNTTISIPSRVSGDLNPKQSWYSVGGGESADVAVHPVNPNIIYATTYSGIITRVNLATDEERDVGAYPHYTEGTEMRDLKYRWQWNFPIRISHHDPNVIYHTSNFVHRSSDEGQSWKIISPDLSQNIDEHMGIPGGPVQHDATGVEVFRTIFVFEESMTDPRTLWAGSDDGLVHITRDAGSNWQNITPGQIPNNATVNHICLSPHQDGTAYIAVHNYRQGDFKPYIFRTTDFGKKWTLITGSNHAIPDNYFVRCVAEDPDRSGLLYAGTEFGIYFSFDHGQNWQPLQGNLPHVPITDMQVHQGDLVLSTQGRGFWILDDLSVLHQINPGDVTKAVKIFKPEPSYRSDVGGYRGHSAPPRAPYHAQIHFFLKDVDTSTQVSLRILDHNKVVASEVSTQSESKVKKLKVTKGINRWSWNQTYTSPTLVKDLVMMDMRYPGRGVTALPGMYTVELIVDDSTYSTDLEIRKDPRWEVSAAALRKNFELGTDISSLLTVSQSQLMNLRKIRTQAKDLSARLDKTSQGDVITALEDLASESKRLQDVIYQDKIESSQDEINYPRKFTNHLIRLYRVVIGQNDQPSQGELERWEDLQQAHHAFTEQLSQFLREDVNAILRLLTEKDIPLIIVE
ncbi:MAG: glycosyl hydrolase [Saprospiraceae bacterium]|nr:glycosyl hydrolase [Saprospiraceae bacterium]